MCPIEQFITTGWKLRIHIIVLDLIWMDIYVFGVVAFGALFE